jgi:arylsulfatase A-like enzyme
LSVTGSADSAFLGRWRASPFSDAYLQQLAVAAIHSMNLGRGPQTDFLGIAFSAPDYVGHAFGPDSREIEDEYLRLDQTIGNLLAELDRTVGAGNYVVALTADHGVAPIPEQSQSRAGKAGRVKAADIVAAVEKTLGQRLGPGRHILQMVDKDIYFEPGVMQRIQADPVLWREIRTAIEAVPGVQRVFQSRELQQRSGSSALARATALDEFPGRSGDLAVSMKPYWILSASGTTHGTANDYDRRVPLVLYGAGIKRGVYAARSSPADIAPTLASLCGIAPAKTAGRVLAEAIRPISAAAAR